MQWEYMEVKFAVRFGYGQRKKTKKGFWGGLLSDDEVPWELIAMVDSKREILFSGMVKGYGHFSINANFKSGCFQYIQKLGMEGWELVGEMPTTFVTAPDTFRVSLDHCVPDDTNQARWILFTPAADIDHRTVIFFYENKNNVDEYVINIFGASFFFKLQKQ